MAKKKASKRSTVQGTTSALAPKYAKAAEAARKSPVGAPVWKPENDGDAVGGTILSHRWQDFNDGPACSVTMDTGDSAVIVRLGSVLVREFHEKKIAVGTELVIVYRGEASRSTRGRPAKLYSLEILKLGKGAVVVTDDDYQAVEDARPKRNASKRERAAKASKKAGRRSKQ